MSYTNYLRQSFEAMDNSALSVEFDRFSHRIAAVATRINEVDQDPTASPMALEFRESDRRLFWDLTSQRSLIDLVRMGRG